MDEDNTLNKCQEMLADTERHLEQYAVYMEKSKSSHFKATIFGAVALVLGVIFFAIQFIAS